MPPIHVTLHRGSVTNLRQRCCGFQSGDSSIGDRRSKRLEGAIEHSIRESAHASSLLLTSRPSALDGPCCASAIALIRVRLVPIVEAFRTSR